MTALCVSMLVSRANDWVEGPRHPRPRGVLGLLAPLPVDLISSAPGRRPELPADPPPPESFDWRNASFRQCVGPIFDQLKCGSCWAVSTTETFGDRRCIAKKKAGDDAPRVDISAENLLGCDHLCEHLDKCNHGCQGGFPPLAWRFLQEKGAVSTQCMPYNLTRAELCPLPPCKKPLDATAYKLREFHKVYGGDGMRREIVENGPVQATFTVYDDFETYASGVYSHHTGKELGLHAVKVWVACLVYPYFLSSPHLRVSPAACVDRAGGRRLSIL